MLSEEEVKKLIKIVPVDIAATIILEDILMEVMIEEGFDDVFIDNVMRIIRELGDKNDHPQR